MNGGRETGRIFFAPSHDLERIMLRTGSRRLTPTPETPADNYTDLPEASSQETREAVFLIYSLETAEVK